jgi:Sec-independent protein secretion pathway component TatC
VGYFITCPCFRRRFVRRRRGLYRVGRRNRGVFHNLSPFLGLGGGTVGYFITCPRFVSPFCVFAFWGWAEEPSGIS